MKKQRSPLGVGKLAAFICVFFVAGCGSPDEQAQSHFDRAKILIEQNDDLKARVELLNAVKYRPNKVDAWRALVAVDTRTKAFQSLFQDLQHVVELDRGDVDARTKLARIMLDSGAADAAMKVVEAASDEDRSTVGLRALRAAILIRMHDTAEGISEAQKVIEIDPGNVEAVTLVATEKLSRGDFAGALASLDAEPIASKNDLRVEVLKVQIFIRKGDLASAEALVQKLASSNPKETQYREQLVRIYVAQRRLDDAEKQLRLIADSDPADSKAGLTLAGFLSGTKGPDAARGELATRIKSGGDVFPYQLALAELEFGQGHLAEATTMLKDLASSASSPDRKLQAEVVLAEFYVSKANFTDADPLVADILNKDRRNIAGLRLRATIRIEQGKLEAAVADLREALNDQPKSPDLLLMMGFAYERSGAFDLADREYVDALRSSDLNPRIGLKYAAFLRGRGEVARAQTILEQVSGRWPDNIEVLSAMADARLAQQDWDGALVVAEKIERFDGNRSIGEQIKASAFAGQDKIKQSVAALEDAHAASPDAVRPVIFLVASYLRSGEIDKARSLVKQMLGQFPDDPRLLILRGKTELATDQPEQALKSFKAAIDKQPNVPDAYNALSNLYVRKKDYDGAATVIQAGLREMPDNVGFRMAAASFQVLKGNFDGAIGQYESVLKDQPGSLLAANNLAGLLLDHRSDAQTLDKALSLAERLKDSPVPQFQDTLGWAQYKHGDYQSSVATLQGALAKSEKLPVIHYHLGMSYQAMGQPKKADQEFKAALALEPDGTELNQSIRSAMK